MQEKQFYVKLWTCGYLYIIFLFVVYSLS